MYNTFSEFMLVHRRVESLFLLFCSTKTSEWKERIRCFDQHKKTEINRIEDKTSTQSDKIAKTNVLKL